MALMVPAAPAFGQADVDPAVLACIPPALRDRRMSEVSAAQRRPVIACILRHSARTLNAQTPIRMGEDVLESAIAADVTIYYNMVLAVTAAEFGAGDRQRLAERTRSNVCSAPDMRRTIGYGGVFAYNWFDRERRLLHQLRVDRCP